MVKNPQEYLQNLVPEREFFIGIDSDGCVFDTMEIKHKECFCPNFIKHWELQVISKYAREAWEFVNLYSKTRGYNRFLAFIETVNLLKDRKETQQRKAIMPDIQPIIEWTKIETKLGNPALEKYVDKVKDPVMERALKWSKAVNAEIGKMVYGIPPFPFVKDVLEKTKNKADIIVVSQTPVEALTREWEENNIDKYVRCIAGQEYGTKAEHIALAAKGKYPKNKILMIGDAPGDREAAKSNGVLFYPVNPGHEEDSWERLCKEGLDKFFNGEYEGEYETQLAEKFESYLPVNPSWKK